MLLREADDGVKGLAAFLRAQAAEAHSYWIDDMLTEDYAGGAAGNNFETLTRVACNYAQVGARSGTIAAEVDIYDLGARGDGATWADGFVSGAGGSNRLLSLDLLAMNHKEENGIIILEKQWFLVRLALTKI